MTKNTVAEFAAELKKSPQELLKQLKSAGVVKNDISDVLSENDKLKLLDFLRGGAGERRKIVLTKKSTSEIRQADASGKSRTIQVEVRKKRTLVKRAEVEKTANTPSATAPEEPVIDTAELQRREEEARRQAELIHRQEEELAERRRQRLEQEEQALWLPSRGSNSRKHSRPKKGNRLRLAGNRLLQKTKKHHGKRLKSRNRMPKSNVPASWNNAAARLWQKLKLFAT